MKAGEPTHLAAGAQVHEAELCLDRRQLDGLVRLSQRLHPDSSGSTASITARMYKAEVLC